MNGYPRLYIGKAALEAKKCFTFPVYQVTKESLSEFISYYSSIHTMKHPLVIEDISYLPYDSQSNLLKFIEDSPLNIILLSSEDLIISTILSRMSLIYKYREDIDSHFLSPSQAIDEIDKIDKDSYYTTYIKKIAELSPIEYYYDKLIGDKPNKQKLLQIIGG